MSQGYREKLTYDHAWGLDQRNHPEKLLTTFNSYLPPEHLQDSSKRWIPWLFISLIKSTGFFLAAGSTIAMIFGVVVMVDPIFLKIAVDSVERNYPLWFCMGFVVSITVVTTIRFSLIARSDFYGLLGYLNVQSILMNVIYAKAMKLSASSRNKYSAGEVVNLLSTDADRVRNFWFLLEDYIYAPFMIIACFTALEFVIGHNVFYGIISIALFIPINSFFIKLVSKCEQKQMELKDERLKLMTDILSGMKVLKLYAWEESMRARVAAIRAQEVTQFKKASIYLAVLEATFNLCPILATVISFVGYIVIDGRQLTPQVAFMSLMLFNLMRFSIYSLPDLVKDAINTRVSLLRIEDFLTEKEVATNINNIDVSNEDIIVQSQEGNFSWDLPEKNNITLSDISFEVKKGELIGIIGRVGSGKSSLLSTVAGELNRISGNFYRKQNISISYAPQEAWIQNMTFKDNILFGKIFNEENYRKTIDCCALRDDLKMFAAGDMTEIGEKGLNLSGGQKARVALARAVYQDAELYLLDDTLSAVDSHVGAHIFQNVIGNEGLLKDKTRLFALNSVSFLPKCDRIIVIKDGRITNIGTYEELSSSNNSTFNELVKEFEMKQEQEEMDAVDGEVEELDDVLNELVGSPPRSPTKQLRRRTTSTEESPVIMRQYSRQLSSSSTHSNQSKPTFSRQTSHVAAIYDGRLIEEEETASGKVSFKMYYDYAKAFGLFLFALYGFVMFLIRTGLESTSQVWLSRWSDEVGRNSSMNPIPGLGIYATLSMSSAISVGLATTIIAVGAYRASKKLHDSFLFSLLRSPMSFFDTTPMGRILNRLSKDVERIDSDVPGQLSNFIILVADVVMYIASSVIVMPLLGALTVPIIIVFVLIARYYTYTSVQVRRLCSTSWSTVTSHMHDSYIGISCIRAFDAVERFKKQMMDAGILAVECNQMEIISNRWIQLRMDFLTTIVGSIFTGLAIYLGHIGKISGGSVALVTSTGTMLRGLLGWIARRVKDLEQAIVAVERMQEYIDNDHEAEWISKSPPRSSWPEKGEIVFKNFGLRYRPNTPLVLKNLNLKIAPGQKVGIVGRTGAGKTSLTMALFRIIEPASGTIYIDGLDFKNLGLHELRKALTIIPQDPVLFCGTLRANLDPFDEKDDATLWDSIDKAHLTKFVQEFPDKLNYEISEGGSNLSVGQRQLICLARAILRRQTKILILDEATAAVDVETDQLIQGSIRSQFKDCTILTIAHRLNTIMDYDKVLVMDAGEIREFDSPKKLLEDKNTIFYGLAAQAKLV